MLSILAITGPIYIVIALGFVAGRSGLFSRADMRVLGKFVINFALPALLFTALSQRQVADILNVRYLAAYAVGSLAVLLGAFAFARFAQRKSMSRAALTGMGMSFSNSGFVGYPIVLQVVGPPAAVALAMCMVVETLLLLPLTMALAEAGDRSQRWYRVLGSSVAGLLRNPIILAIFSGFAVAWFQIPLSEPLTRTINMLANASTAVALFVIGGSLVGLEAKGLAGDVAAVAAGKLLLHPLAVFAVLWMLAPIDPALRTAAVVYASMPMLSIYPILAQKYHEEGFCAAALLVATLLSFVTVSAILWVVSTLPDGRL